MPRHVGIDPGQNGGIAWIDDEDVHAEKLIGKAIRAVLMEISEYLGCVMVDKDSCVAEYKEKEQKRREKTKGAIKLE